MTSPQRHGDTERDKFKVKPESAEEAEGAEEGFVNAVGESQE